MAFFRTYSPVGKLADVEKLLKEGEESLSSSPVLGFKVGLLRKSRLSYYFLSLIYEVPAFLIVRASIKKNLFSR